MLQMHRRCRLAALRWPLARVAPACVDGSQPQGSRVLAGYQCIVSTALASVTMIRSVEARGAEDAHGVRWHLRWANRSLS